jgi:hypothetical protein
MRYLNSVSSRKMALRLLAVAGLGISVSACTGDFGLGYASDGYNDGYSQYGCGDYDQFGNFYECDYRAGFSNFGYSGGWYNDFYYPGYGMFLFDNYGRRYNMHPQYQRYWGQQRYNWFRSNRGHGYGGRGYGRGRGHGGHGYDGYGYDNYGYDNYGYDRYGHDRYGRRGPTEQERKRAVGSAARDIVTSQNGAIPSDAPSNAAPPPNMNNNGSARGDYGRGRGDRNESIGRAARNMSQPSSPAPVSAPAPQPRTTTQSAPAPRVYTPAPAPAPRASSSGIGAAARQMTRPR